MGKRQNRNTVLAVVIVAILAIVVLSVSGLVQMDWSQSTDSGSVFSATITAYKDGQPVSSPIIMGAFTRGGEPIDSLVVKVVWTSTGEAVVWSTFSLTGSLKITRLWDDGEHNPRYVSSYSTSFVSRIQSDEWSKTLVLGTDICKAITIQDGGWILRFDIELIGTVEDTIGQLLTDTINFAGSATISYVSGYGLDGYAEW